MLGKNLYISNSIRMSKRGAIQYFGVQDDNYVARIEGKKKVYSFKIDEYSLIETNKTVTLVKKIKRA